MHDPGDCAAGFISALAMAGKVSPELQQFLAQEQQKAQLQQTISALTSTCWDKCVGTPGRYLGSREEQCLSDCAKRFLETTQVGNAWAILSKICALCSLRFVLHM